MPQAFIKPKPMNLQLRRFTKSFHAIVFALFCFIPFTKSQAQELVVQRVRLDFTAPDGAVRQILLGFTSDNSATDGFDYGWDAINWDNFANDLNWMIGQTRCVIQGVGSFENTKTYPFGLFLGQTGEVNISLNSLENFEESIPVYIHDTLENTYTQINDENFTKTVESGHYTDRFYITFNNPTPDSSVLSGEDYDLDSPTIRYASNSQEIIVRGPLETTISNLKIFDLTGKMVFQEKGIQSNTYKKYFKSQSTGNYVVSIETDRGYYSQVLLL